MEHKPPKHPEETIEDRLDRINVALQNTMQEMDVSSQHIRNASMMSYLNSYTTSYCNFDWIDAEPNSPNVSKLETRIENNIEDLLLTLDRSQMQIEDFRSDHYRTPQVLSFKQDETELYIQKLEKENRELRSHENRNRSLPTIQLPKNSALEKERKNFEEKLAELDFLTSTYKIKHSQVSVLEENLRIKESLLEQKEKQLRQTKIELDRSKSVWEQSVVSGSVRTGLVGKGKVVVQECGAEEAPPPALTPNRSSQILSLQQSLKICEMRIKDCEDEEEKEKLLTSIEQTKNKIATLRGEQAIFDSGRSSRIMKEMKKTMEKEVNYEENLRKLNLERFAVKGTNRSTPKASVTPNCVSNSSKRFLF